MQEGRLPREKRNVLLAKMTEEVADLVLRNNYLQSLAISLTEAKGPGNREQLSRLMDYLEGNGAPETARSRPCRIPPPLRNAMSPARP